MRAPPLPPPIMTGQEVADLLRVSRDTVYRLAAAGALPALKVGRVWRFSRKEIEQYARLGAMPTPLDVSDGPPSQP